MAVARKKWTSFDTVQVAEAVIANEGKWLSEKEFEGLKARVGCTRGSAEVVVWRMQTRPRLCGATASARDHGIGPCGRSAISG